MAESRRLALTPQLDIEQILLEAQHRWLRPAEICEILRNYQKFCIAPEPPNKPPSGSLFLFDRKVLRYFRKDGHNWRKKKDGKTVKEAHERLKAGSIDVLHCYYAHGEENENFQRRSYWMLEEDLMHIVLVHYREVQGKHNNYGRTKNPDGTSQVCDEGTAGSNSLANYDQMASRTTTDDSPNSAQTSEYEDADHDNYQASSRYHPFVEMPWRNDNSMTDFAFQNHYFPVSSPSNQGNSQNLRAMFTGSELYAVAQDDITKAFDESALGLPYGQMRAQTDLPSWDEVLGSTLDFQNTSVPDSAHSAFPTVVGTVPKSKTVTFNEVSTDETGAEKSDNAKTQGTENLQLPDDGGGSLTVPDMNTRSLPFKEGNGKYTSLLKHLSLDISNGEGDQGLQKYDSFSRWMSKELGEVDDSYMRSSTGIYWDAVENDTVAEHSGMSHQDHLDSYLLSPSLSQDQLFSIIDFSPTWSYTGLETKVLITGTFLENKNSSDMNKWSCMFGEIEVPAEVLADGILRCYAPPHKAGRVPFYVTCSNRLACSEVREFEYVVSNSELMETSEAVGGISNEMLLQIRLEKMLSVVSPCQQSVSSDKAPICNKISSLLEGTDDEFSDMLKKDTNDNLFMDKAKDEVLRMLLKAKLRTWLLCKVAEDGKGPNILDKEGQGVIHLAAALGYDWAVAPTVAAGVSINFRDASGWTALHWAASCGREGTVVALVSLGAASGALTDPTPKFPNGRTPADLASSNGHKGIAGFLAESSLTTHLSTLTLKESGLTDVAGISTIKGIEHIVERDTTVFDEEYLQTGQSMKDSLSAVRNAAQAAARIHQVFRVQSFHRKKLAEYGDAKFGLSDEEALSLVAIKSQKSTQHDGPVHAAAIRIQNKFRGWKGRKEFLITRQRIVKIQAHVRGHQVRKHLRKICWSVGIMEKVILRWRRKGTGLRGFRSEALIEGTSMQKQPSEEDDYDFLKEGRKQTEARLEKALARVKSMVQYPEARDQYRRLLTGVEEFKESKVMVEKILYESEEATDGDIMFDIEELLGEDTPMV